MHAFVTHAEDVAIAGARARCAGATARGAAATAASDDHGNLKRTEAPNVRTRRMSERARHAIASLIHHHHRRHQSRSHSSTREHGVACVVVGVRERRHGARTRAVFTDRHRLGVRGCRRGVCEDDARARVRRGVREPRDDDDEDDDGGGAGTRAHERRGWRQCERSWVFERAHDRSQRAGGGRMRAVERASARECASGRAPFESVVTSAERRVRDAVVGKI